MSRSKALTWTELRVGVVVIVSLVVLAFTILYIGGGGGSPFARKYELNALMTDVNGLKPGAPVRVGGVEVGTVDGGGLRPEAAGWSRSTMKLDRKVQPPRHHQEPRPPWAAWACSARRPSTSRPPPGARPSRTAATSPPRPRTPSRAC